MFFTIKRIAVQALLVMIAMGFLAGGHSQTIPDNTTSTIGVNFWFFQDWAMYYYPFVDFFRSSRMFWPQNATGSSPWSLDGVTLDLDGNGYPRSLPDGIGAATLLFWGHDDLPVPAGDYTFLYDGDGEFAFEYNCSVVSSVPGRIIVNVNGNGGILIKITRTNPADYVRNIRLIMPGFEDTYETQPFHPEFLRRLKPFRALRFMDWMATNESDNDTWENRTTLEAQTYATHRGVALEEMIRLCNTIEADPWFNLPHGADDTFIRNFVTMVRDSLKPCLKAHFEYSNEVWLFAKAQSWCNAYGTAAGYSGWGATVYGWATRATEMMKIVEDVYGDQLSARVVRVLGTQLGNTGVVNGLLGVGDAPNHFDAIAVAPYFNNGNATGSVDAVVNAVAQSAPQVDQWIQADLSIAREHNMRLIGYEGGLDIWNTRDTWGSTVRFDPRMKAIYKGYLESWKAGGGELFMQYTFCNPHWGLLKDQEQNIEDAPMYMAALEFIEENPRWWEEERLEPIEISSPRMATIKKSPVSVSVRRTASEHVLFSITGSDGASVQWVRLFSVDGRGQEVEPLVTERHGTGRSRWRTAATTVPGLYLMQLGTGGEIMTRPILIR